jgi:hypothetical protein
MSRTFRIRHRRKLVAANLPVTPPKRLGFCVTELKTPKELHESYRREAHHNEPQIPDVSGWAAIVRHCESARLE